MIFDTYVRAREIIVPANVDRDDLKYRDMVNSFNGNIDTLRNYLENNRMLLVTYNNHSFFINAQSYTVADVSGMGLESGGYDLEIISRSLKTI